MSRPRESLSTTTDKSRAKDFGSFEAANEFVRNRLSVNKLRAEGNFVEVYRPPSNIFKGWILEKAPDGTSPRHKS